MRNSEIKSGLIDIADRLKKERKNLSSAKVIFQLSANKLTDILEHYKELIDMVDELPDSPANNVYKDEKDQLKIEYIALKKEIQNINKHLNEITEF